MCQVSCVMCRMYFSSSFFSSDKVVKLLGGRSVINGAYPVYFFRDFSFYPRLTGLLLMAFFQWKTKFKLIIFSSSFLFNQTQSSPKAVPAALLASPSVLRRQFCIMQYLPVQDQGFFSNLLHNPSFLLPCPPGRVMAFVGIVGCLMYTTLGLFETSNGCSKG